MRTNLEIEDRLRAIREHYVVHSVVGGLRLFLSDDITKVSLVVFSVIVLLGVFGPMLTPYPYDEVQMDDQGQLERLESPSSEFLLGTNERGEDLLSRLVYGARPTLVTGFLGGAIIMGIGLCFGVVAGYYGGLTEGILMRLTDFAYGIPLIPTAIVLVAFFGVGFWETILIIGFLLWRGNARVFRSQVLQIKERPHVRSAKALGASDAYVIFRHILPNMGGMIVLFFALGIGITILVSASLAFIGITDPFIPTWGIILRNAYQSGIMTQAWWWSLPPGFMISITVLTTYLLGRGYERLQQARSQGGMME